MSSSSDESIAIDDAVSEGHDPIGIPEARSLKNKDLSRSSVSVKSLIDENNRSDMIIQKQLLIINPKARQHQ